MLEVALHYLIYVAMVVQKLQSDRETLLRNQKIKNCSDGAYLNFRGPL